MNLVISAFVALAASLNASSPPLGHVTAAVGAVLPTPTPTPAPAPAAPTADDVIGAGGPT